MLATIFNGVEIAHLGALIILGDMRKPKSKIVANSCFKIICNVEVIRCANVKRLT